MTERKNWRGAISHRRRAVAESENSDTDNENGLLQGPDGPVEGTNFCSHCCNHGLATERIKLKKDLLSNHYDVKIPYKSTSYREEEGGTPMLTERHKLEMKVLNDELNEQESCDKQAFNKQKMEDVTEMLRTLSIYAHSLDMRHKVSVRLLQLADKLVPAKQLYRPVKETTSWTNVNRKLQEMVTSVSEHCELPDVYVDTLDEYRDKHKDFTKATANFCRILQGRTNMSNTQLRKLELQYDEIRARFSASKSTLNSYLEDLLETRIDMADRCLKSLTPILSQTIDCDQELVSILKEMPPIRDLVNPPPRRVSSVKSLPDKIYRSPRESTSKHVGSDDRCTCGRNGPCS